MFEEGLSTSSGMDDSGVTADPTVAAEITQPTSQQAAQIPTGTPTQAPVEGQAAEEIPAEQIDQATGKPLSSYQRLQTRFQTLEQEHKAAAEKLSTYEADGPFVGIKIDKVAAEWAPGEQIAGLPEAHRAKLVSSVMENYLPSSVNDVVKAQIAAHPDLSNWTPEFEKYANSVIPVVQIAYARPIGELNQIVDMTQGYTPEQLRAVLSGQAQQPPQYGQQQYGQAPPTYQASPQQGAALYTAAEQVGMDVQDPAVQQFIGNIQGILGQASAEMQTLRSQIATIGSQVAEQTKKTDDNVVQTRAQEVDQQVKQLLASTLQSVTAGRIPQDDRMTGVAIESLAATILGKDVKAQGYLAAAKSWAQDGLDSKAKAQLGLYAAAVARAYKDAAEYQLGKVVKTAEQSRTEDEARANQARLGAGASAVGSNGSVGAFLSDKKVNSGNAAEIAIALYDQQNQRAS